jgi:hypothetical protein
MSNFATSMLDTVNNDMDIIKMSKFANMKDFNVDDYEVFEESYIKEKARERLESYCEEWWDNIMNMAKNENQYLLDYVKFDINEAIEGCIMVDGIEHCAGLSEFDTVEYEDENYYVINRGDIPW